MFNKTIVILAIISALLIGYRTGINKAMTAKGYIEGNSFLLELNGNLYEWIISGE